MNQVIAHMEKKWVAVNMFDVCGDDSESVSRKYTF